MLNMKMILGALLASATLSPMASQAAELPVLGSGGGPGHGWVAIKFSTDGAHAQLNITGNAIDQPGHAGAYFYDPSGNYGGGTQVLVVQGMHHVVVQGDPIEGVSVDERASTIKGQGYGAAVTYRFNDPNDGPPRSIGTFRMVLMSTRSANWSWELKGNPGVQILGTETGTETDAFVSDRFSGSANVAANIYGVGARASAEAVAEVTAQRNLVGTFWQMSGIGAHVGQSFLQTPDGAERQCTCGFGSVAGGQGGPGPYRFRTTGAGVGLTNSNEVFVGYADATPIL